MPDFQAELARELSSLLEGECDAVALAANTAALIYHRVPRLNWAGFYFLQGGPLVVGPFQGLPACARIPLGRGVCGTAAAQGRTIVVPDVHLFPGHIACDGASASEIVVPLFVHGRLTGVLDLDSPDPDRFSADDQVLIESLARCYTAACTAATPG